MCARLFMTEYTTESAYLYIEMATPRSDIWLRAGGAAEGQGKIPQRKIKGNTRPIPGRGVAQIYVSSTPRQRVHGCDCSRRACEELSSGNQCAARKLAQVLWP